MSNFYSLSIFDIYFYGTELKNMGQSLRILHSKIHKKCDYKFNTLNKNICYSHETK